MLPEDRLDELLARRNTGEQAPQDTSEATPGDALLPLLEAASELDVLGTATPSAAFVESLRARLLAQAEALRAAEQNTVEGFADPTLPESPILPGSDYPTLPGIWGSAETVKAAEPEHNGSSAVVRNGAHPAAPVAPVAPGGRGAGSRARRMPRRLWQAVAAAVLLLGIGGSLLTTNAMARPGSPFYALYRWGQDVRVGLDTSPADRVRLHLSYAGDALSALNTIVAQRQGGASYRDALATLRDEDTAAAQGLAALSPGSERDTLAARLAAFQQTARQDLRAALNQLGWSDRVLTTTALGSLGEPVPVVASVQIAQTGSNGRGPDGDEWRAVITGAGFQSGAACIFDGQPAGTVISAGPTQLVVVWTGADSTTSGTFGVQNPDGTAAQTANIQHVTDDQSRNSGSPTATPATNDDGGDRHGGHGGDDGGSGSSGSSRGGDG